MTLIRDTAIVNKITTVTIDAISHTLYFIFIVSLSKNHESKMSKKLNFVSAMLVFGGHLGLTLDILQHSKSFHSLP